MNGSWCWVWRLTVIGALFHYQVSAKWLDIIIRRSWRFKRDIQLSHPDETGTEDGVDVSQSMRHQNFSTHDSYGLDVSFPIHHHEFSDRERPFGDIQEGIYKEFMEGCRNFYNDTSETCDKHEEERIEQNLFQPSTLENYTDTGFKKMRAPPEMFTLLENFFKANHGSENEEFWDEGDVHTNHWASPTYMLFLQDSELESGGFDLLDNVKAAVKPILEEWCGIELSPTQIYGIRIYTKGSILSPHVDRERLVASAIVNVAQDVDEPWVLEVIDFKGKAQNVTMEPGDMVLYESRTVVHGRPYPLRGRYFANVFIHFQPLSFEEEGYDEEDWYQYEWEEWLNWDEEDEDMEEEEWEGDDLGEEEREGEDSEVCSASTSEKELQPEQSEPEMA